MNRPRICGDVLGEASIKSQVENDIFVPDDRVSSYETFMQILFTLRPLCSQNLI